MTVRLPGTRLIRTLIDTFNARFEYTRMRLKWLSVLGIVGYPAYYIVWVYLFPQPYENILLRSFGFAICATIIAAEYFPGMLGKHYALYIYIAIILVLPFFFTFMLLRNNVNVIWLGSAVCGILYLTLLHDPLNLIVSFITGTCLAVGAFLATTEGGLPDGTMQALPVIIFALAGGTMLNHSAELITHKSLQYGMVVGSSIAHEMRTPLLSIRMDSSTCRDMMPVLLEAHRWAVANGWSGPALDALDLEDLESALSRIRHQTGFANTMVDMLLMNVRGPTPAMATIVRQSMSGVVRQALETYPFRDEERSLVHWRQDADFTFAGSDLLMRHVLFNLFKNALRAIAEVKHGTVEIRLEPGADRNRLFVRDTGSGVPESVRTNLFEPFYSGGTDNTRVGIGLTFCRRVVEGVGGTITCRSEEGAFTEFEISLPTQNSDVFSKN